MDTDWRRGPRTQPAVTPRVPASIARPLVDGERLRERAPQVIVLPFFYRRFKFGVAQMKIFRTW